MANMPVWVVEPVQPEQELALPPELVLLPRDAVESGASVGFAPPLSDEEARRYWQGDSAERLYRAMGSQEAGVIPDYARKGAGTLVFYMRLGHEQA